MYERGLIVSRLELKKYLTFAASGWIIRDIQRPVGRFYLCLCRRRSIFGLFRASKSQKIFLNFESCKVLLTVRLYLHGESVIVISCSGRWGKFLDFLSFGYFCSFFFWRLSGIFSWGVCRMCWCCCFCCAAFRCVGISHPVCPVRRTGFSFCWFWFLSGAGRWSAAGMWRSLQWQ